MSLSDLLFISLPYLIYLFFSVSFYLFFIFFQWATVTFHLPHHVLKLVASTIVSELKKINQNVAALSVASSIMDRLSYLLSSARPELGVGPGRSVDRWASRKTNNLFFEEWNNKQLNIPRLSLGRWWLWMQPFSASLCNYETVAFRQEWWQKQI